MSELSSQQIPAEAESFYSKPINDAIQANFILLVTDTKENKIVFSSNNTEQLFDINAKNIISQQIDKILNLENSANLVETIKQTLVNSAYNRIARKITIGSIKRWAIFYQSEKYMYVEIVLSDFADNNFTDSLENYFNLSNKIVTHQGSNQELTNLLCKSIASIIGFDSVWYCEFDVDGNGYISAEYTNGNFPSNLNHRFPHTNIPSNIRDMYTQSKFRIIIDSKSEFIPIIDQDEKVIDHLDLSYSFAALPTTRILQYLANVDTASYASFAVISNNKLIGIFGAYNKIPKFCDYQKLEYCQMLVDYYLVKFELRSQTERQIYFDEALINLTSCIKSISDYEFDLEKFFRTDNQLFQNVIKSSSCMCYHRGRILGSEHFDEHIRRSIIEFIKLQNPGIFSTHSLSKLDSKFLSIKDKVSGVISVNINDGLDNTIFVWLRTEIINDKEWVRPLSKAALEDISNGGPRQSYTDWMSIIGGTCIPWKLFEIDVAKKFRTSYIQKRLAYQEKISAQYSASLDASLKNEKAEEHRFSQSILNASPYAIISTELDGTINKFNQAAQEMLGYSKDEIFKLNPTSFHDPRELALRASELSIELNQDFDVGFPVIIAKTSYGRVEEREWTYVHRDRTTFKVMLATCALYNENEDIIGYLCIARDISERKRYEEEIKQHRDNLQNLVHEQTKKIREDSARNILSRKITALANQSPNSITAIKESIDEIIAFTSWNEGNCYLIDNTTNDIVSVDKFFENEQHNEFVNKNAYNEFSLSTLNFLKMVIKEQKYAYREPGLY